MRAKNPVQFVLKVKDPVIQENCGVFRFELGREQSELISISEKEEQRQADWEVPEVTISELVAALYGVEQNEKIPQREICLLSRVYLNEIV